MNKSDNLIHSYLLGAHTCLEPEKKEDWTSGNKTASGPNMFNLSYNYYFLVLIGLEQHSD